MMFIPSVDGVSHCEREFTTDDDMVSGLETLTNVAWEMVNGALTDQNAQDAERKVSA
jgi:N-carbamoyl-L-amino-acid hydrolase